MSDKEKIKQYLEYKGISKNKFYTQTGLSVGFLDSGNSLGVDKLRIIISVYSDINLEWLITGKGGMIKTEQSIYAVDNSAIMEVIREKDARIEQLIRENERMSIELDLLKQNTASAKKVVVNM